MHLGLQMSRESFSNHFKIDIDKELKPGYLVTFTEKPNPFLMYWRVGSNEFYTLTDHAIGFVVGYFEEDQDHLPSKRRWRILVGEDMILVPKEHLCCIDI